jgi:hypothetical protein
VVASIVAVGCIEQGPVSPSLNLNELIVHAVLDAGSQHQYVVVQTTAGSVSAQRAVTGAAVTLTTPDGSTLTADEVRDSLIATGPSRMPRITTVYAFDLARAGMSLVAGGTYRLRIVAPDGREVTGETTMPDALPDTTAGATQDMDLLRDTIALHWARVPGARTYEVFVRSTGSTFALFTDTSVALRGNVEDGNGNNAFTAGLAHQLIVNAVDANYYDYYRRSSGLFTSGGPIMHLRGGSGLFGSVVPVASRTIIVR